MEVSKLFRLKQQKLCLELGYIVKGIRDFDLYNQNEEGKVNEIKQRLSELKKWLKKAERLEAKIFAEDKSLLLEEFLDGKVVAIELCPVMTKYLNNIDCDNYGILMKDIAGIYTTKYSNMINRYSDWHEAYLLVKHYNIRKRICQGALIFSLCFGLDVADNFTESAEFSDAIEQSVDDFLKPFKWLGETTRNIIIPEESIPDNVLKLIKK